MPHEFETLAVNLKHLAIDLDALRLVGPWVTPGQPAGVPRSEVTVPISDNGRVDDTVLFVDPADGSRTYYLPRYRLRIGEFSGQYEITTELVDGQWRMTFALESFPAPEIEAVSAGAVILPHDLSVTVSSGSGLVRNYPVAEFHRGVTDTAFLPVVVLQLSLAERDELLRAFTRDEERARIDVHRLITVAVPTTRPEPTNTGIVVAIDPDALGTPVILPDLVIADLKASFPVPIRFVEPRPLPDDGDPGPAPDEAHGDPTVVRDLGRDVRRDAGRDVLRDVGADVLRDAGPAVGLRQQLAVDASFAEARSSRLAFSPPAAPGILRPADVLSTPAETIHRLPGDLDILIPADVGGGVFIPDPGTRPDPRPFPHPFPHPFPLPQPGTDPVPEQRFTVASTTLTVSVPLRFDVDAHPYLFPSGRPTTGGGFETLVVAWPPEGVSSRNHVYFHDEAAGNVFYYLPDVFLIGQRDQAPYGPELSFTVGRTVETASGEERAIALISVHLVPQTSAARLHHAARSLAEQLPAGSAPPELRPAVHPATCRLELPDAAVTTSASPDLVRGWWVSEVFDFDDLRDVYAVLTTGGAASALLRGRVDVDVMGQVHQVPVEVRLDRPAVPPLSWVEEQRFDAKRTVDVTLRNDGDVPVALPSVSAWVSAGREPQPATVTGALPAELAPGATITLEVRPRKRPAGGETPDALLDLTAARLVVEPEKAVEQTLDRRVARLPKVVKLFTNEGRLGTSGDPDQDIDVIALEFENPPGLVAVLDRSTMTLDVAIPVPLVDLLLNRGTGEYRYKQVVVRVSGASSSDADWRSASDTFLLLPQA